MKKHVSVSNILFVIVIALALHTPTRVWLIRLVSFTPSIESSENSKKITNYNWELEGLNTPSINFEQYKGKVIFLNFWATWCPPCIAELPYIQTFYDDYNDEVAFVFISKDNWTEINAFFKEHNYNFKAYKAKNILEDLPRISSIPRTFVIDKKGNIRIDKAGSADWNSASFRAEIDDLLKE